MLETVNEIFGEQLIKDINVNVPEGLLKISKIIDDLAKKSVTGSALSEIVKATTALNKAQDLLNKSYAITSKAQQDAARLSIAEAKAKETLAKADLQVAKAETERIKQSKILEDQQRRNEAQTLRQQNAANQLTDAYKKLDAEHKKLVAEAKATGIEFGVESDQFKKVAAAANEMRTKLVAVDEALGFSQRNVGNYKSGFNAISNSINQLTREAPAFANSVQTGFMAISNNFAAFQDAIQQVIEKNKEHKRTTLEAAAAAKESAIATAKAKGETDDAAEALGNLAAEQAMANAEGKKGASVFAQIGKSIFSVTTLISVAVTLLTVYGASIVDWLRGISAAQREFEKATKENIKAISEETGSLQRLQGVLNSSTASTNDKAVAMDELNAKYPGLLRGIGDETASLDKLNGVIERQIGLLVEQAKAKAAMQVVTNASNELTEALLAQEEEITGNNRAWALFMQDFSFGARNIKLTADEQRKYNDILANEGRGAALVYRDRLAEVKEATDKLTQSIKFANEPHLRQIEIKEKEVNGLRDEIKTIESRRLAGYELSKSLQEDIKVRQQRIFQIEQEIYFLNASAKATANNAKVTMDAAGLQSLALNTRTLGFKRGTRERVEAEKAERRDQLANAEKALQAEYRKNDALFMGNVEYTERLKNLRAKANDEIAALDESFAKSNKPKDLTRKVSKEEDKARAARLAAERELTDAQRDNLNAQLENNIQHNKAIYENDEYTLDARTEAYAEYYEDRRKQAQNNADKELRDIVELEKEISLVEKEPEKRRSDADKALLLRKEGIAERRKGIEKKLIAELSEIQRNAAKDTIKIFESESDQIVKEVETRNTRLMDANEKAANAQLIELGNRLKSGNINYGQYLQERRGIEIEAEQASLQSQLDSINQSLLAENLSADSIEDLEKKKYEIRKKYNKLELDDFNFKEDQKRRRLQQGVDAIFSSANANLDAISSLYDHEDKKREDMLDAASARLNERIEDQITAIKASSLSEEEKEEKIAILQGQRRATEKEIEEDRKKAAIAQAKRNKAIAIAQIILTTAQAIIAAFAEGDPYTKAFRSAAAGVAGAAQLAVAVATPIPQYAKGTMFHKGGKMIVGDGGERELIKEPNKAPYWSPDTDTIMWAKRGTQVIPESQLANMTSGNAIKAIDSMGGMTQNRYDKDVVNALNKNNATLQGVGEAIKNKQEFHMQLNERGLQWGAVKQNEWNQYVGRIINI